MHGLQFRRPYHIQDIKGLDKLKSRDTKYTLNDYISERRKVNGNNSSTNNAHFRTKYHILDYQLMAAITNTTMFFSPITFEAGT